MKRPIAPKFRNLKEKCSIIYDDESISHGWSECWKSVSSVLIPNPCQNSNFNLEFRITYKHPFGVTGREALEELLRLKETLKGENNKNKVKTLKTKIFKLGRLVQDDLVLAKFFASKVVKDAVLCSFFKMRETFDNFPSVKFLMKSKFKANYSYSSQFIFVIKNVDEDARCVCAKHFQFAREFERIQKYIENCIQIVEPNYKSIDYHFLESNDYEEIRLTKKIPLEQKDRLFLMHNLFSNVPKRMDVLTKQRQDAIYLQIFLTGQSQEVLYYANIFEILWRKIFEEERYCNFCLVETPTIFLHPFAFSSFPYTLNRKHCDQIYSHQRKNDDHRMCPDCFLLWFRTNSNCPVCRKELSDKEIESLKGQAISKIRKI